MHTDIVLSEFGQPVAWSWRIENILPILIMGIISIAAEMKEEGYVDHAILCRASAKGNVRQKGGYGVLVSDSHAHSGKSIY